MRIARDDRRAWYWAFALAAVAPLLTYALLEAELSSDTAAGDALWITWLTGSVGATAAAGMANAFRGVLATASIWGALTLLAFVAWDPSCGLQMSQVPHGVAALAFTDASGVSCLDASRLNNASWPMFGGFIFMMIAIIGALVGGMTRWIWRQSIGTRT